MIHATAGADVARRVVRSKLRPLLAGLPGGWFGAKLQPGVVGFTLGNFLMLAPVPPDRTLLGNRKSPTVFGRIVHREDRGCDLRLSVFTPGYPYRIVRDPAAMALFDEWLSAVASDLGAQISRGQGS